MCVTFVTCEVRVCGLRCRSGSSLYIYRVYFFLMLGIVVLLYWYGDQHSGIVRLFEVVSTV